MNRTDMLGEEVNLTDVYDITSVYDNSTFQETVDPFAMPTWRKVLYTIIFSLMVAAADLGNIIVIWIVVSDKRMRSVTNYFLVNLSVADIINATFNVIPNFTYMLSGHWPFGLIYCKLGTSFSLLSVTCSVFTLVAISIDRYNAIIYPLRPRLSRFKTIVIATSIWIVGVFISVPPLLYQTLEQDEHGRSQCISKWPDAIGFESNLEYGYNVTFMVITYFLPVVSMLYTYSRIGCQLWGSHAIGEATTIQMESIKSKRKVVKMLLFVVIMFCVCWLPYHGYFILAGIDPTINMNRYIQDIYLWVYWMAMSNSMYNPMIYCYMNARFRKGFIVVLSAFCPCFTRFCVQNTNQQQGKHETGNGVNGIKMNNLKPDKNKLYSGRASHNVNGSLAPSPNQTNRNSPEYSSSPSQGIPVNNVPNGSADTLATGLVCKNEDLNSTLDSILSRASRLAVDKICISVCESPDISQHSHSQHHNGKPANPDSHSSQEIRETSFN